MTFEAASVTDRLRYRVPPKPVVIGVPVAGNWTESQKFDQLFNIISGLTQSVIELAQEVERLSAAAEKQQQAAA